ncbi:unnamed protein product [Nippostrongylus brasiliensis]|uniref:DDE_3 domain-containing protein n=1 Tax=Nippostrongylus brasiliensis TaxID=27835 RepID=A0A0N4XF60_NIPBR|nr:unnamed protein product [Nippostrongylus brasiliensis]
MDFVAAKDWPSNSPDLNPLNYSGWAILEKNVCSTRHSSLDTLKEALVKAWDELDNDYLRRTVDAFPTVFSHVFVRKEAESNNFSFIAI